MGAQINKKSSLKTPKENRGLVQQSLLQQNLKNIPNNLAGALTNNNESRVESNDKYRENIINEIKMTEQESYPPYYVSQIFEEKIKGKTIPNKYLQKIIDEIGKVGACDDVLYNPDEFKGGKIEDCVCSTLKKGYYLEDYIIGKLTRREPFDHIKLLKGMLALNTTEEAYGGNVGNALVKYLHIFYRNGFKKISKEDRKTIPNLILESKYYTLLLGLIGSEFKRAFQPTDEFYEKLKNKICENQTKNTPENRKKNLMEYAQATDF